MTRSLPAGVTAVLAAAWRRPSGRAGLLLLAAFYAVAAAAPFLSPCDPATTYRDRADHPPEILSLRIVVVGSRPRLAVPATERTREADTMRLVYRSDPARPRPLGLLVEAGGRQRLVGALDGGPVFFLGSDRLGRDVLSRTLHGARVSLSVALLGVALSTAIGLFVGGLAGYLGGWVDAAVMRLVELVMMIPGLYLLMTLAAVLPKGLSSAQRYALIVAVLSTIGWASLARVVRGIVLSLRTREFVVAAEALGARPARVLFRHLLPHTLSYVLVAATLAIPFYILGESALSYIGLGIQEPEASWGNLLTEAKGASALLFTPWRLFPGLALVLSIVGFNLVGDVLRDAADPTAVSR